jgi:lysozyme
VTTDRARLFWLAAASAVVGACGDAADDGMGTCAGGACGESSDAGVPACVGSCGETVDAGMHGCAGPSDAVRGVDVSDYEGTVDWPAVRAAGRAFAFAKATEGVTFVASSFAGNWPGMRDAGVLRGAYHFFRPQDDGTTQADFFVDEIERRGGLVAGDLAPVADVEVSDSQSAATVVAELRLFLARVEARTGRRPMIYTANFFWGGFLGNPDFASYALWVANYDVTCPRVPTTWTAWTFWQYSDSDAVTGISGAVDGDVFDGSIEELRRL